jgi:serine/threonine protein kinase/tetratricopeptide (TPR) repeat protein
VPETNDSHPDLNQTADHVEPRSLSTSAAESAQRGAATPSGKDRAGPSSVRVPGYTLLEVLGRGGMGIVYKARQEKANRLVALKMILSGTHAGDTERQRFQAEAEAVALLAHPNIVQVYEVGETPEGHSFFSLEYVSGGTLAERLRKGPLPPAEAAALLASLAEAMQHAHERGIVHRDLKPQNLLLTASGQVLPGDTSTMKSASASLSSADKTVGLAPPQTSPVVAKISDFGLAKRHDEDEGLTQTGAILGTPSYMAPEQAFGHSKHVGPAADIYALGAILYECLTGRPPFRGVTLAETLEQVRTRDPVAPREFMREIPRELEVICLHCLHKEPERRYLSAAALAEDVRRFREGRPIAVRPVGRVERGWRWCRRNPVWAAMLTAVALLLCGVTGVSLYAYVTVAAMNDDIRAKNEAVTREAAEKEKQRRLAVEKGTLAEKRLLQSIDAVSLFARDARVFCEDAMVPAESRQKLYEVLIAQLEKNVDDRAGPFDEDMIRNKILMYQQIAQVNADLGGLERMKKAREWDEKGLALTELWLKAKPGDPAARSHRAAYVHLLGVSYQRSGNKARADAMYKEALDVRRELWSNPEYRRQIDRFTPGKSYTNLCDSLDTFHLFDESLKLREAAYKEFGTFELLDAWCWTCWKAGFYAPDYARKKAHLAKCVELSARLAKERPTSRGVLKRWAFVLRDLGELEYNHGRTAEAREHYRKLAEVTEKLATAPDLARQRQSFARAWYTLGVIEKKLGHGAEARKHFERCRLIREELIRDYPNFDTFVHLRIDWLFALVALGEHARAVAVADEIRQTYPTDNNILYRLTCIYSLSIPAVEEARGPTSPTAEDGELQASYRDKALKALQDSLFYGNREYFNISVDADLDPIRSDPRFGKLLKTYKK